MKTASRPRPSSRYRSALQSQCLLEPLEPRTLCSATPASPATLVAQANNQFAFDLFPQLAADSQGNKFFSPYSIATALEMTLLGAGGNTAAQLVQALHLPQQDLAQAGIAALYQLFQANPATAGYTLSTANRLWISNNFPILQSFLSSTQNVMGAGPQSIDFSDPSQAAATINAWVSDQTHGKIPSLISPDMITPLTRLILTNAIYFKGNWASAFDPALTIPAAAFQVSPTQTVPVQMMQQEAHFNYYAQSGSNGYQALDMPYQGGSLDMLVILPTASTLDGFSFTPQLYSQITSNLRPADVDVLFPQFKLQETYDLVAPLENLGIHDAFGSAADFSGISPESLMIGGVIHKSFIQVDETGTEAAAATGIVTATFITAVSSPPIPIFFDANHPFLFAIRDNTTNTILFMGQVSNPGPGTSDNSSPPTTSPPATILPPTDPVVQPPLEIKLPSSFPHLPIHVPNMILNPSSPGLPLIPVTLQLIRVASASPPKHSALSHLTLHAGISSSAHSTGKSITLEPTLRVSQFDLSTNLL